MKALKTMREGWKKSSSSDRLVSDSHVRCLRGKKLFGSDGRAKGVSGVRHQNSFRQRQFLTELHRGPAHDTLPRG